MLLSASNRGCPLQLNVSPGLLHVICRGPLGRVHLIDPAIQTLSILHELVMSELMIEEVRRDACSETRVGLSESDLVTP